jgi:hypothetical protein
MSANPEPRRDARETYYYSRRLSGPELLPALAIGVGAGLLGFYIARLLVARTPIVDEAAPRRGPRRLRRGVGAAG